MTNIDPETARAFDRNWGVSRLRTGNPADVRRCFDDFFLMFPLHELGRAEGFDLGCGTGQRAAAIAPHVAKLHCIDPSPNGIAMARKRLADRHNVEFHVASVDEMPIADSSQGFGYSIGVLHHIPDTEAALRQCVSKLKPGAPFLLYLYYALDNRPAWFRAVWRSSDIARRLIARLPFGARRQLSNAIGAFVYFPLSRFALFMERAGRNVENYPLGFYRHKRFRHLGVHALDRFGTRLEQRFSRAEMEAMMIRCGLGGIRFQEKPPYWVAIGYKA
ncbi:MAG TPA: class I SAM-dependent methyltransferase [Allosphingosinicella sp.]